MSHRPIGCTAGIDYSAELPWQGRAEALRQAMLALMADDEKPYYAHPTFWAPFVVVGEDGVPKGKRNAARASAIITQTSIFAVAWSEFQYGTRIQPT